MPGIERRRIGLHLAWLLSVVIAGTFVTAMILVTGDLHSFWPLYIVPIVIASLAYQVGGAVLSVASIVAIVALLIYGVGFPESLFPELAVGLVAFAASGLVIGIQTQRYQQQRELLEMDATRDALTGTWRWQFFESRLTEEVARSARYGTEFTVALVDVPDFGEFRRQFGRVKADLLLERLAHVMRLTERATDLIGRQGPSRFAIIMLATGPQEAELVTERIREAVAATEFEGDALEPTTHISLEIASANYPGDADEASALLSLAERRLGPHFEAAAAETVAADSESDDVSRPDDPT